MAPNSWPRRISRAEDLRSQYAFATEILTFYIAVAKFQQSLLPLFEKLVSARAESTQLFAVPLSREIASQLPNFLSLVKQNGPAPLRDAAKQLSEHNKQASHFQMLDVFWNAADSALQPGPDDFFARAFLQPYAELIRSRSTLKWTGPVPSRCPHCQRKPGLGVLRPLGEGGQRFLVCSFCLGEWEFRRIICPGCGEENYAKLPVYTAEELKHIRVEACDTCRTYIKSIDMTKAGRAEPLVDEMASIPLDLWADQQGYAKLQRNLLQQ